MYFNWITPVAIQNKECKPALVALAWGYSGTVGEGLAWEPKEILLKKLQGSTKFIFKRL